ncbi:hypothetical protein SHKM778_64350 [Streptomyces sp. KM77-8]|uniref:Uncharacterized protein n=1 Tax=Streptomyces haneummycinicus TaxID=3074435 RepID=A0AAT9HS84_9ACTN
MALGGVGVGGAQQALAADGGEDLAHQGVEGAVAVAVGGHGDTRPDAVGAAGARALALHGGREELVDRDVVPDVLGGGEAGPGARPVGVPGEPVPCDGTADESGPEDQAGGGRDGLGPSAPTERPGPRVRAVPLRLPERHHGPPRPGRTARRQGRAPGERGIGLTAAGVRGRGPVRRAPAGARVRGLVAGTGTPRGAGCTGRRVRRR